jgi:hypothetical protein
METSPFLFFRRLDSIWVYIKQNYSKIVMSLINIAVMLPNQLSWRWKNVGCFKV